MADLTHSDATGVEVHTPIAFTYADETARLAAAALTPPDLKKFALQSDDASVWVLIGVSPNVWAPVGASTGTITAANVMLSLLGGSSLSNLQVMQDVFHSSGHVSGAAITDVANGTITVTSAEAYIRATSDPVSTLYAAGVPSSSPADVLLIDLQTSWLYIEYNAGSPRIVTDSSERADSQASVLLARIYREGTTLHINDTVRHHIADHAGLMIHRLHSTMPFARESGASLSETGTRNVGISAGVFWEGLTRFTTDAFDSSGADNFSYWYTDGAGGWNEVDAQSQFDNLQYDLNGTLTALDNNQFGVHWVYLSTDSDVHLVYGVDTHTLVGAQLAAPPTGLPTEITTDARLIGRIIIGKSDAAATDVSSVFDTTFEAGSTNVHNDLTGLQGGAAADYQHLTTAQVAALAAAAPLASPAFTGTPTGITKTHVGLGNVDNTSDADKPVSTAQGTADGLRLLAIGGTVKNLTETVHTATSLDIDVSNGNIQIRTLAGNETATFTNLGVGKSVVVVYIPGANTLTLSAIAKWTGAGAPASIEAEHWIVVSNIQGVVVGTDLGGAS